MSHALQAAELLHGHVEQAWAARLPAEACPDSHQRTRNAESMPWYHVGYQMTEINSLRSPEVIAGC